MRLTLREHNILASRTCTAVNLLSVIANTVSTALLSKTQSTIRLLFGTDCFPQGRYSITESFVSTADIGSSFLFRLYVIRLLLRSAEKRRFVTRGGLGRSG